MMHRPRWLSFSLRTMLIVVAITAVLFGWIARARIQAHAVAKVRELCDPSDAPSDEGEPFGFRYSCDRSYQRNPHHLIGKSWVPKWIINTTGIDYFHTVEGVSFWEIRKYNSSFTALIDTDTFNTDTESPDHDFAKEDQVLGYLRDLKHIKSFSSSHLVGDLKKGKNNLFEVLGAMPELEYLYIGLGNFRDRYPLQKKDILNLRQLDQLQSIKMNHFTINSDENLILFSDLKAMKEAEFYLSKQTTLLGFQSLKKLDNVDDLTITFEEAVTKEHIDLLANSFPKLNLLQLDPIPDPSLLEPLRKHPSLKKMHYIDPRTQQWVVFMPSENPTQVKNGKQ